MRFEDILKREMSLIFEPLLMLSAESRSPGQVLGSSDRSLSTWVRTVKELLRALEILTLPDDWIGYLELVSRFGSLISDLKTSADASGIEEVVEELVGVLVSYWLHWSREPVFVVLDLLGLVQVENDVAPNSIYPRPIFSLNMVNVGRLLESPADYGESILGLDLPDSTSRRNHIISFFVPRVSRLLRSLGLAISSLPAGDGFAVRVVAGPVRTTLNVVIQADGALGFSLQEPVTGNFELSFLTVGLNLGLAQGTIQVRNRLGAGESSFTLGTDQTGIKVGQVGLSLGYRTTPAAAWSIEFEVQDVAIAFGQGATDSFVGSVSGGSQIKGGFDAKIRVDSTGKFSFVGDGGLGARIVLGTHLGPITIDAVEIACGVGDRGVSGTVCIDISGDLGPLSFSLTGLGVGVLLAISGGQLTSLAIEASGEGPTGLSVSIDSGPVSGGGLIRYERNSGRYSGALALSIGSIALRAIGILDTRAPGVPGYSFLIVISAEFSPIQLGFGFTLNGVGGLCGIQRSISVAALQSGVRDGSLAPLLFSRDPMAQAAQLITGLQRIFPPTSDSYVFGPMFKLGWGTPTLVTVDLGIVLQVPSPIVIVLLGTLSASLPRPEAAVVVINLDIVGVLEVTEKRLSIDASLRDSRVAAFTLTGDMALRFSWGAEPDFALSIGGFNPAFRPPPSFPTLRRLSLALGSGANPRLSLAAYFALTSNSLQFGARAELYATAAGFTVQGYLEFHALFIFRPFSFQFDFAAGLSLKRGNSVLAAITVTGQLKGPRPWYIKATASITVLFFDVSVNIERTFGEAAPPELATPVDVWTRLLPALADVRNWSASLPAGRPRGVSTAADRETPPRVRLDPMSQLAVRQKVLPLDRRITKLGEAVIGPAARFRIRAVRAGTGAGGEGGTLLPTGSVNEPFAAAQYQTLTDAERLSSPSFQPMAAGVEALGAAVRTGGSRPAPVRWRTLLLEPRAGEEAQAPRDVSARMAGKMGAVDAAKDAGLRATGMERFAPSAGAVPTATLEPERWTLASTRDLDARPGAEASAAWGTSAEALRELPAGERGRWQVVPSWEVRR